MQTGFVDSLSSDHPAHAFLGLLYPPCVTPRISSVPQSCRHLDFKHSVFGRVVGGLDILSAMEKTPTDPDDCPTSPITITGARGCGGGDAEVGMRKWGRGGGDGEV